MSHSKSILCLVALSCLILQLHALKYIKTQDEGKFIPNNPLLLDIHDNTTFVLAQNQTISVYSPKVEKPCNITLDLKTLNGTWQAKVLAINKTIVYKNDKFIVIDFKNCSTDAIVDVNNTEHELEDDKVVLIAYNDTFDIFDSHQQNCTPCRYNYKGEKIEVAHKLTPETDKEHHKGFTLDTLEKNCPGKGYFYTFKFANGSTVLRKLSTQFELLKQRLVDYNITAYSSQFGNVSICYKKLEKEEAKMREPIVCELLDEELKTKFTVPMYKVDWDNYKSNVRIQNLQNGSALAVMSFEPATSADTEVYVQQINPDGQLEKEIKVITVPAKNVTLQSFLNVNRGDFVVSASYKNPSEERMYLDVMKPEK